MEEEDCRTVCILVITCQLKKREKKKIQKSNWVSITIKTGVTSHHEYSMAIARKEISIAVYYLFDHYHPGPLTVQRQNTRYTMYSATRPAGPLTAHGSRLAQCDSHTSATTHDKYSGCACSLQHKCSCRYKVYEGQVSLCVVYGLLQSGAWLCTDGTFNNMYTWLHLHTKESEDSECSICQEWTPCCTRRSHSLLESTSKNNIAQYHIDVLIYSYRCDGPISPLPSSTKVCFNSSASTMIIPYKVNYWYLQTQSKQGTFSTKLLWTPYFTKFSFYSTSGKF